MAHSPDVADVELGLPAAGRDPERERAVNALQGEMTTLFTQMQRMYADIASRFSPGMLPGTFKVFSIIAHHGPLTASAVSERMILDKSQVSRVVRELADLGLVERAPDPADGRSTLLSASAEGARRLGEVRGPDNLGLVQILEEWSVDEVDSLARLIRAIRERTLANIAGDCPGAPYDSGSPGGAQ